MNNATHDTTMGDTRGRLAMSDKLKEICSEPAPGDFL